MSIVRYIFTFILLLSSIAVHSARLPDDVEPGDSVNEIKLPLTKESAAELIRVETKGKVLSVDTQKHKSGSVFKIKVLHDDGTVKIYRLDATSGRPPA
ncbi:MAG: hypothetical protein P1P93_02500 [Gammaproteobacteria bacterium]|nr:hypothetical protein [Gammaproteobacteria bacterium]MDT8371921.1 hypothetical protein [Gammaproteobacteria bacterium]